MPSPAAPHAPLPHPAHACMPAAPAPRWLPPMRQSTCAWTPMRLWRSPGSWFRGRGAWRPFRRACARSSSRSSLAAWRRRCVRMCVGGGFGGEEGDGGTCVLRVKGGGGGAAGQVWQRGGGGAHVRACVGGGGLGEGVRGRGRERVRAGLVGQGCAAVGGERAAQRPARSPPPTPLPSTPCQSSAIHMRPSHSPHLATPFLSA
jgi:hypothetical protein